MSENTAEQAAESSTKSTGQMLGDFGSALGTNIGWDFVADGVTSLFGLIFGGQAVATSNQVAQLTADVQQGFATVESQLNTTETDLANLSQQVSAIQTEVVDANSSAAAGNCNTILAEANGYVSRIQNTFGNYQTTLDPQWLQQNLVGQSSTQALQILGSTIYGQNAGTPPFSSGVTSLQNSVSDLGALLLSNGPTGSGIIPSCASAVSAGVAANFGAAQAGAGLAENQSIIAAGSVEQAYFDNMHQILSYYAGWLAIGQDLASRGGQMGAALLAGDTVQTAADVNGLCVGVVGNGAASAVTCPAVVFNTQNTINQINAAWNVTGASWYDVSNGLLVGDARAGTGSAYMTPAQRAWVQDIAKFGSTVPGIRGTGYVANGPLNSNSASGNTPVSGIDALASPNWAGLTFAPAKTAAWQYLLPTQNCTATADCVGWNDTGALMWQGGLMNGGTTPTDLLLYTGESSQFNTDTGSNGSLTAAPLPVALGTEPTSSGLYAGYSVSGSTAFPSLDATALSFLDTNTVPQIQANPVIQAPATAEGAVMSAAWPMNDLSYSGDGPGFAVCAITEGTSCGPVDTSYSATLTIGASAPGDPNPDQNATNNREFYGDLTVTNKFKVSTSDGSVATASYSIGSSEFDALPSFMNGSPQQQYLWPVLNLPLPNSTAVSAPCPMTSFSQGFDGQAGVGNVCQQMYNEWQAGALGVQTGRVSVTAGGIQGTLTPAGNNTVNALINNLSGSAANVTVYADVTAGDAEVGTVINTGSSAGDDGNGVSITNCSTNNGALQCSLTVQPGSTVINIPVTGANGATSYTKGTFVLGLAGSGVAASSTTTITPTMPDSAMVVPSAVGSFTAGTDTKSTASTLYAALAWTVPTANPGVTGYQLTITDPTGDVTTQTATQGSTSGSNVVVSNGYTAGAAASVDLQLPSTQSGIWTIKVAAINAAGAGPASTATAALGNSAPATPTGFSATETKLGPIKLAWKPVSANPPLSNYSITITPPSSATTTAAPITVVTNVPQYLFANVTSTGTWTFSLTATNSVGSSKPATTTVNVTGTTPTKPLNLDVDVDADGWVSVSFNSSLSVPSADNYWIGLYAPGQTAATASLQVPVANHDEKVRVRNFYQLGSNSPTGTWSVVVSASNGIGVGDFAQSALYVSSGLISAVSNNLALQQYLDGVPSLILQSAEASCAAGNWHPGLNVFGTCVNNVFTAAPGTSGWTSIGSPVGTTTAITDGTTTPTPGATIGTSGAAT